VDFLEFNKIFIIKSGRTTFAYTNNCGHFLSYF